MERIGKPKGLIRLSSQTAIEGGRGRLLRLRVILYPALMLVLATAFLVVFFNKKSADVTILQGFGLPYSETAPGEITNQVQVIIENRSGRDAVYQIEIAGDAAGPFRPRAGGHSRCRPARPPRRPWRSWSRRRLFSGASAAFNCASRMTQTFKQEIACRLLGPVRADRSCGESFRSLEMSDTVGDSSGPADCRKNGDALAALVLADLSGQPDQRSTSSRSW